MAAKAPRIAEVILEYQNVIDHPPIAPEQAYQQACSNDKVTIESWRNIWVANAKANHERFKSFKDKSVGKLFDKYKYQPAIVIGSGPSLKYNAPHLKEKGDIVSISCLHNFHYLEDLGVGADYYVTLDAGPVVIEEVYEGGSKTPDEYWAMTKGKTLLAYIGTDPRLFDKWQGEVLLFNCPIPDESIEKGIDDIEVFRMYIGNGGNVLGACMYIAKAVFGCSTTAFMGADFAFGYNKKFHAWDSKYDKSLGFVLKLCDVYGNKVLSWQSYANFKAWFEYVAQVVPGVYINCSEGGALGSYPEGNIAAIRQMTLEDFLSMLHLHHKVKDQCFAPEVKERKILF